MNAQEIHNIERMIALALWTPPAPPTDEEITQFMREYDEGKHRLSAEDEAALEAGRIKLMQELRQFYGQA